MEVGATMKVRTVLPWLNKTKFENGKMKSKSRLAAGSFQEPSSYKFTKIHPTKIYLPVQKGFHVVMNVIATNQWLCNELDIKTVFLQSHSIDRNILSAN